jgi:hypothetical protein
MSAILTPFYVSHIHILLLSGNMETGRSLLMWLCISLTFGTVPKAQGFPLGQPRSKKIGGAMEKRRQK